MVNTQDTSLHQQIILQHMSEEYISQPQLYKLYLESVDEQPTHSKRVSFSMMLKKLESDKMIQKRKMKPIGDRLPTNEWRLKQ